MELKALTRVRGSTAKNAIVALHGYGDNAANFIELADEFRIDDVAWVAAQAPRDVPHAFGGGQWYDLFGNPTQDIENSFKAIVALCNDVAKQTELPLSKVYLLGFSQGAFMSLYTALRMKESLAGVIALSGYIAQVHRIPPLSAEHKRMPVFVGHGNQDQVVLPHMFFETLDVLDYLGFSKVTSKMYSLGHSLCPDEMRDIEAFVKETR